MAPSFQRTQKGEDVAFLLCGAGAPEHDAAVAFEPLLDLCRVGESLGIRGGCERLEDLPRARMPARAMGFAVWQVAQLQSLPWVERKNSAPRTAEA
jgi:hypothetical protein